MSLPPLNPDETYLTEKEVIERWRGSATQGTLRQWRCHRKGPSYIKLGKSVLYPLSCLVAFEAERFTDLSGTGDEGLRAELRG